MSEELTTLNCPHISRVEDDRVGEEICIDCGLVVSTIYYNSHTYTTYTNTVRPFPIPLPIVPCAVSHRKCTLRQKIKADVIRDLCSAVHIEGEQQVQAVRELSEKFQLELVMNKVCFQAQTVHAYAVYHFLQQNKSSFRLKEMAKISGIRVSKLWKLEKIFQSVHAVMNEPEKYVEKMCYFLHLPRNVSIAVVSDRNWNIFKERLISCRPINVAAAIVYKYARENCRNSMSSQKEFCTKIGVNPQSLRQLLKKINI
jgi:transcription initiation factor TFIIIB Brf1 subunit/transcription initiation factor TFIIB